MQKMINKLGSRIRRWEEEQKRDDGVLYYKKKYYC